MSKEYSPFKMKGSPMQRNFGISPAKDGDHTKEGGYFEDSEHFMRHNKEEMDAEDRPDPTYEGTDYYGPKKKEYVKPEKVGEGKYHYTKKSPARTELPTVTVHGGDSKSTQIRKMIVSKKKKISDWTKGGHESGDTEGAIASQQKAIESLEAELAKKSSS